MSTPVPGNPNIDVAANELLDLLRKFNSNTARNLSFQMLGSMVAEFGRVHGIVIQHYGVKISQKDGGNKGAAKQRQRLSDR